MKVKTTNEKFTPINQSADEEVNDTPNLKGDYKNVGLLLLLYTLQGIPQGISTAIPIFLQNRGVSYAQQAGFSIAYFPFALKLLWAPVIDSIFIKSFGRRKTWICSSQFLIGIFMIYLSKNADVWLGNDDDSEPQIAMLATVFFILLVLTSFQDIAVDGWGLTLLHRRNIGYAATTNGVGFSAGRFIGFIVLLVFESKDFCNTYIYSQEMDRGLFTLSEFIMFWAVVYLVVTTLVALFKHENPDNAEQLKEHSDYGICKAYLVLYRIIKLRPVIELYLMIFTIEGCFATTEAVTSLKLIEYGVPKEKFALMSIPSAPVQIILPLLITKYTAGRKPLSFYSKVFICRLVVMVVTTIYVSTTQDMLGMLNQVNYFYAGLIVLFMMDQATIRATYASDGSFFSKISDPLVGGSYMTLLNTLGNLGKRLFTTIFLWLVDKITWRTCEMQQESPVALQPTTNNTCLNHIEKVACHELGGNCQTVVDGYYIESAFCLVYGLVWYKIFKSVIFRLQRYPREDWYVLMDRKSVEMIEKS